MLAAHEGGMMPPFNALRLIFRGASVEGAIMGPPGDTREMLELAAEKGIKPLQNRIVEAQEMANRARASMRDTWIPYGQNIEAVLDEIDRCQWIGDKPLGPLGRYVKAREPEKWGDILRGQLLTLLTAFAITNPKDREQLKRILAHYRK